MTVSARDAIDRLLHPKSIALVGASDNRRSAGGRALRLLQQHGYQGEIFPVNPNRDRVGELACYATISDIPVTPDIAVFSIPAAAVPPILAECADKGIAAAYVVSSGFGESTDDPAATNAAAGLSAVLGDGRIRIAGPNGIGLFNVRDCIPLGFSPVLSYDDALERRPGAGNVAVVAQSGGVGFGVFNQGLDRGIDFSYVVSTGNEVDLGMLDYLDYFVADPHTNVIVAFIEGLPNPRPLLDLGRRAAAAGKVLVVAKVGRSQVAQEATVSHTGQLAGPAELYSALFRAAGIVEVTDVAELLDVVAALARWPRGNGRRLGIVTGSGGTAAWLTDVCNAHGLDVPRLADRTRAEVSKVLPDFASLRNPVDITAAGSQPEIIRDVARIVGGSGEVDAVVIVFSLVASERAMALAKMLNELSDELDIPLLVFSQTQPQRFVIDEFGKFDVPWFTNQRGLAQALRVLVRDQPAAPAPAATSSAPPMPAPRDGSLVLPEADVKQWLRAARFPVPRGALVTSAVQAAAFATDLGGPVALKVQASSIAHKSSAGVMALGLETPEQVRQAYRTIWRRAVELTDEATLSGVLVEEMVTVDGFEMLLSATTHAQLGTYLAVGAGGVRTEVYRDTVTLLAPVDQHTVHRALRELRCADLLLAQPDGRGLDVERFCELAATLSTLAVAVGEQVKEIELNPVVIHASGLGLHVLDALATRHEGTPDE